MNSRVKALISQVKKSRDGRVLASNFGFLMLLQTASYLFPLFTIPYLARVIGVEGFGKIAFAVAVIIWFQTISDWGFSYTATRDVARNRENLNEVSKIFSNVLWARLLLMLVSLFLLLILILIIPYFNENKIVLLLTFLMIPGDILYPAWFFQAMEKMKYITIFNLLSRGLFTVLVFIFIKTEQDYILQPLLVSLGFLMSAAGAMYLLIANWGIKIYAPKFLEIVKILKGSFDVFINNISRNLYNSFSVVLLGYFSGSTANGLFDAGRKFVNIAQVFMSIFDRVFFPLLSRRFKFHNLYEKGMLFISTLGAMVLFLSAPFIIRVFYTDEFLGSIPILQLMSISLISTTLNSIYGTNYLVLIGKEKTMRNITLVVSMIGFIAAFPMTYYFSYIGAAINIVSAQASLGIAMMIASKKQIS